MSGTCCKSKFLKADALAVIDVKPTSSTYSQIVHTVTMPNNGDEFHHSGWNARSPALSPLAGQRIIEARFIGTDREPKVSGRYGGLEVEGYQPATGDSLLKLR